MSIGTVDRVLHKRGRVAEKTEERVRRIIEELDYTPNIFAKHLKLAKTYTFGILMPQPSQDSMYWTLPVKGIRKAHKELSPLKIAVKYFYYDKYSASSFERISREVLTADLDGLAIAPVLSSLFDRFVQKIPDSLPYVFFDSFIPNANYVSYIGQDSFQSGIMSGRLMNMLVRNHGIVAVIKMLPEDYHINDRVAGFAEYCAKCPDVELKQYCMDAGESPEKRSRVLESLLSENHHLNGIFVTNATTHQVAAFVRSRSVNHKIHIIGYDLVEENVRFLKEGVIDFLISQQPEKQGHEALHALYRHVVLEIPVKKKVFTQLDIVTQENIDYYVS